jgi:hypothetical protein
MQSLLLKLQNEIESRKKPRLDLVPVRSAILGSLLVIASFMLGARTASSNPGSPVIRAMVEPAAPGLSDLQSL